MATGDRSIFVPTPVETYEPDGIDYAWIMQVTFVLTILIGAPVLAIGSIWVDLPTWSARAQFAVAFGSVIWILIGTAVFIAAARRD